VAESLKTEEARIVNKSLVAAVDSLDERGRKTHNSDSMRVGEIKQKTTRTPNGSRMREIHEELQRLQSLDINGTPM
jgi:hypothetical protein